MTHSGKEDLRTRRANINQKTFYLHYDSLDDLLRKVQNELAQAFIERTKGLKRPRDLDKITREFFLSHEELGKLGERITCSGSYHYISRRITNDIMGQVWKEDKNGSPSPYIQNIYMAYVSQSTLAIYKQWIADGKRIPLEDIIQIIHSVSFIVSTLHCSSVLILALVIHRISLQTV